MIRWTFRMIWELLVFFLNLFDYSIGVRSKVGFFELIESELGLF